MFLLLLGAWLVKADLIGQAQPVHWASQVVGFSSEGKGEPFSQQYRATQVLGRPNKLPNLGESPCAWSPANPENLSDEWVRVRFAKAVPIRQVVVAENVNPGSITQVVVYDRNGREHTIYQNANPAPRSEPLLRIILPDSSLIGQEIRVTINPGRIKGPNQIDGIGVTSAAQPVEVAIPLTKNLPKDLKKENLGKTVNSAGEEVAPVITPDGRTLYFTRRYHPKNIGSAEFQDIWSSRLVSKEEWGEAVNIGPPINTPDHNAISGISPDGRSMYLTNIYKPDGSLAFGISRSIKTRNGWSTPLECKIKNHYNIHKRGNMEFTVAPNGRVMVIAVQRKDSYGDKDLYVTFLLPDQTWSEPKHMGPVLNTADYEGTPFIASDAKTLYFSSSGHPEYGDGDIFVSRRLDSTWTDWSSPENLGPLINTTEWDGYFTIPASGDFAYLSSKQNSLGNNDLFRLKLYPEIMPEPVAIVSGQVLDAQTQKPVSAEVIATLVGNNTEIARVDFDAETGEYKMILPVQKAYQLNAQAEGYFPTREAIDLSREKRFRDIRRNLYVSRVKSGQKMILKEVLFEQSKYELLTSSYAELDRLVELMKENPDMEVLVEGHTDNQGEWDLNMKLAEDRVRVVKAYLTDKGIAEKRVQTKAWGPSKPIASNQNEEKRKLNRRVEFTILKM
ncbi:OmpA family protein [Nibrella saemangeumensis]